MKKQKILIQQLDNKFSSFSPLREVTVPGEGWLRAIRQATRMSLRQLGKRLRITAQSVRELEEREKNGTITLKRLRQVGEKLQLRFVYGFIPESGSLSAMIEQRAMDIAREIVMRTSLHMNLEAQGLDSEKLQKAIEEKAQELQQSLPRYLWD